METWKPIENSQGKILVSDKGRIKSMLRDGRILKVQEDKKGYLRCRITLNKKSIERWQRRLYQTLRIFLR